MLHSAHHVVNCVFVFALLGHERPLYPVTSAMSGVSRNPSVKAESLSFFLPLSAIYLISDVSLTTAATSTIDRISASGRVFSYREPPLREHFILLLVGIHQY